MLIKQAADFFPVKPATKNPSAFRSGIRTFGTVANAHSYLGFAARFAVSVLLNCSIGNIPRRATQNGDWFLTQHYNLLRRGLGRDAPGGRAVDNHQIPAGGVSGEGLPVFQHDSGCGSDVQF